MIETVLRNYLEEEIKVPVLMEFPHEVPEKFVLLKKIDGGRRDHISAVTFRVEVRGQTLYETAVLAESAKDALLNAISIDRVSSSMLGGERQLTDTANNLYEYDLTFNFYYYQEE